MARRRDNNQFVAGEQCFAIAATRRTSEQHIDPKKEAYGHSLAGIVSSEGIAIEKSSRIGRKIWTPRVITFVLGEWQDRFITIALSELCSCWPLCLLEQKWNEA